MHRILILFYPLPIEADGTTCYYTLTAMRIVHRQPSVGLPIKILGGKAVEVVPQAQVRTFGETDAPGLFRN